MAEGTYEYECMRAELLGIEKPDYDEFIKKHPVQSAQVEDEDLETEQLKDADHDSEKIKHISGGLEELNSILQVTQRKINRFKASCGSLTNLLKIKIGHGSSSDSLDVNSVGNNGEASPVTVEDSVANASNPVSELGARQSDLSRALDNNVDRIDSLIEKAEHAQYGMAQQRKEMKRFLN